MPCRIILSRIWENDSSLQTCPHHMLFSYRETLSENHVANCSGFRRSNQEEKGSEKSSMRNNWRMTHQQWWGKKSSLTFPPWLRRIRIRNKFWYTVKDDFRSVEGRSSQQFPQHFISSLPCRTFHSLSATQSCSQKYSVSTEHLIVHILGPEILVWWIKEWEWLNKWVSDLAKDETEGMPA